MEKQIIALISELKEDPQLVSSLNGQSDIMEDGGLDSLQMISFILKVEEQFGVEIDFETFDFALMSSVEGFCQYIAEMRHTASA